MVAKFNITLGNLRKTLEQVKAATSKNRRSRLFGVFAIPYFTSGICIRANLDFKFVAANTLIKPPSQIGYDDNPLGLEDPLLGEFAKLAENFFFVRDPAEKEKLQKNIGALIERSYKLLKPGGVCALIVSDAFCHEKYAQKAQNWLLTNSQILRLDFCGDIKIFDAGVHNVIPLLQNADGKDNVPERRLHKETFGNITQLGSDKQSNLTYRAFFPQDTETHAFSCKTIVLEDICYATIGMVVNAHERFAKGAFTMEQLVQDTCDKTHPKRFVEGKHLGMWLPATHRWIEWGTERAPALFRRQSFSELFEASEKILVQRSPGPDPKCCYDNQQIHFTESSVGFVPWHALSDVRNNSLKKAARYADEKPPRPDLPQRENLEATSRRFSIKYLLAVMNSSTARDFLRANRRSNIHLYPNDWKQLPIPDISLADQQPLIDLVDRILAAKSADPATDVTALESEIDRLVYALYHLTDSEIEIVEGGAAIPPACAYTQASSGQR